MTNSPLLATYALQPVNGLQLCFITLCLFGVALLFNKPRMQGVILLLVMQASLMLLNFSEETQFWQQSYLITPVFSLCTGPLFYLMVRQLAYADIPLQKLDFLHFIPALLALGATRYPQWVLAAGGMSLFIYLACCFILLRRYHQAAQAMQSDTDTSQLRWLQKLLVIFALLAGTDVLRTNLQPVLSYELRNLWYLLHQSLAFLFIASLIRYAVNQPQLFDLLRLYQQKLQPNASQHRDPLQNTLFEHIDQSIRSQHWYRQPRLSLLEVASRLGLDSKTVSSAINHSAEQNFSTYINGLRVLEVQAKLDQTGPHNVLQLALAAGFNSKSAFNKAFKQQLGITPSHYLKQKNSPVLSAES